MTTPSHPPDDDLPRDPAFDDAWRALSREEPSAALDAAVRAAARREIGAGPQVGAARGDVRPRRSKPMSWWQPLAVAATLGALAVGLLQLVTPERIGAPGRAGDVVSDMPATTAARQAEAAKKQSTTASDEVAPSEEKARAKSAPAAPAASGGGGGTDRKEAQMQSAAPPAEPAPVDDFEQQGARKDATPERKRDAGPAAAPAHAPPATPAAKRLEEPAGAPASNVAPMRATEESASPTASGGAPMQAGKPPRSPAPMVAPPRVADPFPAESVMREAAPTKREAASDAVAGGAPTAAGAIAPSAPEPPKAQAPKPAAENRAAPLEKLKTAPAQSTGDRGAAVTDSTQLRREQDAQAPPQGKPTLQAPPAGTLDARVVGHPELAVPDWITLIRRLIAEKNYTAADKELAAFRAAHPDAQRLLPPDLREWKAPR